MRGGNVRPPTRTDRVLAPSGHIRQSSDVAGRDRKNLEAWRRLADYVRSRRVEVGFRSTRQLAIAVDITEKTIGKLERGQPVNTSTLAAVEAALQWSPGSAAAVLAGGEPTPRRAAPDASVPATAGSSTALRRILDATPQELVDMRAAYAELEGAAAADRWLAKAIELHRNARRERRQHPESNTGKEVG